MMSDGTENLNSQDHEEVDPGLPVVTLAGFEQPTSATFLTRVRQKIQRRTTTAQVVAFSWKVPSVVFLELWGIVVEFSN